MSETVAGRIAVILREAGVRRLFGMPGGGSNADLIEAAGRAGLPFSLAHTEAASAFMAAAQAEITGRPGACLATLGPGAASIVNGVAQAHLDRVPLIVLTDCVDGSVAWQHQLLPQGDMFRPLVKWSARLTAETACDTLRRAVLAALEPPAGPVHLDVSSAVASSAVEDSGGAASPRAKAGKESGEGLQVLKQARRPLFLIGLGARVEGAAAAVRGMAERFGIPALVTYKAKGVVPDRHPWFAGVLTNGSLEREVLQRADVLVAVGLDPVELLPRPWPYEQPVIGVAGWPMDRRHLPLAAELVSGVVSGLETAAALMPDRTDWTQAEVKQLRESQRSRMRPSGEQGALPPHRVVELAADVYSGARATVDAGAHMFPVMAHWPATEPCGMLISNGLSTMGFGLPAGIGAALLDPSRPTVVFTGDGGLMMCLGELRTAAREALPLRIIVFDDGDLSLIKLKQVQRGYSTDGVSMGAIDWRTLAVSMGLAAWHADTEEGLRRALRESDSVAGPALIAAKIDGRAYEPVIRALRADG